MPVPWYERLPVLIQVSLGCNIWEIRSTVWKFFLLAGVLEFQSMDDFHTKPPESIVAKKSLHPEQNAGSKKKELLHSWLCFLKQLLKKG